MKKSTRLLAALAFAAACTATPAIAHDHDDDDDDFDWRATSAEWWRWAFSIPAAPSPLPDIDGRYCMVGQRGPVWFLAGNFGTPATRTCTVPADSPLFFPVINSVNFNSPNCTQVDRDLSVAELRALVSPSIDGVSGLSVQLNNRPVRSVRRIKSKVFTSVLPPQNLFELFGVTCLVPGRLYHPSVDDGYYVRLRGLSEGQHHLAFRATNADGFSIDMFYTLNAVKVGGR